MGKLNEELTSFALEKHGGDAASWEPGILSLATDISRHQITLKQARQLISACQNPAKLKNIVAEFEAYEETRGQYLPHAFKLLANYVDDSYHELSEWVDAILDFRKWLAQNQREAGLFAICEYLNCCAEAQAGQPTRLALPDVLEEMLQLYGFEGESSEASEA